MAPSRRPGQLQRGGGGEVVGRCPDCGKACYRTRRAARAARRVLHPAETGMMAYRCGDYWHLGHSPRRNEIALYRAEKEMRHLPRDIRQQVYDINHPREKEQPMVFDKDDLFEIVGNDEKPEPVEAPAQPAPTLPHEHAGADRPSPRDLIVESLTTALPCPVCALTEPCRCVRPVGHSVVEDQATVILHLLTTYGYMAPDVSERIAFDPEATAQWLAERSGFARYTQIEDGWKSLLEAEADVHVAAQYAAQRVTSQEVDTVRAAKASLLTWHAEKKV